MPKTYSIQPVTLTWQHNTYVTIGLEISADGALRVYKAYGGGTANNMKVCYPQSDTFVQANVITKIDIPQSEGQHSMAITVWWDNQSGQNQDHNNHTITFTVVSEGSSDNNKVVLADGTVLIDLTADTVDAEHLLQGYTAHDKSGAIITGTASGGGGITTEPLSVTANGVYTAESGKAYTPVTVTVADESEIPPVSEWSGTTFTTNKAYYLDDEYTIPAGYTLIIGQEQTLTLKRRNADVMGRITNSGTIQNEGTIYISAGGCGITNNNIVTNNNTIIVGYESVFENSVGSTLNNNRFIEALTDAYIVANGSFHEGSGSELNCYGAILSNIPDYNDWGKKQYLDVTRNGTYVAQNGLAYGNVSVNVQGGVDETEYTAVITPTSRTTSITFTGLQGNPREWWITPAAFTSDSVTRYYYNGGVKTGTDAILYICHGSSTSFNVLTVSVTPIYSNGTLKIPQYNTSYFFRQGTAYTLHYKL